jgi:hypothetical protein
MTYLEFLHLILSIQSRTAYMLSTERFLGAILLH